MDVVTVELSDRVPEHRHSLVIFLCVNRIQSMCFSGNLVQIEKEPQRIVSLMPSNTELLFALGAGKQVVGVTDQDDYPEEVKNLPKVSAFQINAEQVVALKPDLVVASSGNEKEVLDQLKKLHLHE